MAFRSILDPKFQYRNAASTDITQTFKRVRGELLCPSVHVATNLDKASKPQVSVGSPSSSR